MKNNIYFLGLVATLMTLSGPINAQPANSVRKIGYLSRDLHPSDSRAPAPVNLEAFREGLRQLGYIEGKNIVIEYRYAEGRFERLPALAEELVGLNVEIIVADTTSTARAARKVTTTIPIVFLTGSDPTQSGLAISLARPGGNVTGVTNLAGELRGKRLELLKEVVPKATRFALLEGTGGVAVKVDIPQAQEAAQTLGIKLQVVEVNAQNPDFEIVFRFLVKQRIGALVVGTGSILGLNFPRKQIVELAERNRMPAIYPDLRYIDNGGLMSYGVNPRELSRRGATFVDKILKGAKPAELPVERPVKFDFVINLKAAQQVGLTIPSKVLMRADRVIK